MASSKVLISEVEPDVLRQVVVPPRADLLVADRPIVALSPLR